MISSFPGTKYKAGLVSLGPTSGQETQVWSWSSEDQSHIIAVALYNASTITCPTLYLGQETLAVLHFDTLHCITFYYIPSRITLQCSELLYCSGQGTGRLWAPSKQRFYQLMGNTVNIAHWIFTTPWVYLSKLYFESVFPNFQNVFLKVYFSGNPVNIAYCIFTTLWMYLSKLCF